MIGQSAAILLDQYRELNNRKLFWIAMIISAVVVLAFAIIGIRDGNLVVLNWRTAIPVAALGYTQESLHKGLFLSLGVNFWLAWLTSILALVTTAGMIPDFITSGSIDLALSKPIGRIRLFLTKYAAGLLFVTLQVSVFTILSFFVIGFRGGGWEPALFLAVPLVIVFFSYLFSVCVLLGLLTRSTIASLILTLVFWFLLFALNVTEITLVGYKEQAERQVERLERRVDNLEKDLARTPQNMVELGMQSLLGTPEQREQRLNERLEQAKADLDEARDTATAFWWWHTPFYAAKTALPKTSETITLLQRALIEFADLEEAQQEAQQYYTPSDASEEQRLRMAEAQERGELMMNELTGRSITWVLGSSLAFEAVILSLCCWIFVRRDF